METVTFKPTHSKIIVFWLTMSAVILCISILNNPQILSDLTIAINSILYVFGASLIFNLILFHLPHFHVDITKTHVIAPDFPGLGTGWQRSEIPIEDIDLTKTAAKLPWLGFYIIRVKGDRKIALWCFDDEQYQKIISLMRARR